MFLNTGSDAQTTLGPLTPFRAPNSNFWRNSNTARELTVHFGAMLVEFNVLHDMSTLRAGEQYNFVREATLRGKIRGCLHSRLYYDINTACTYEMKTRVVCILFISVNVVIYIIKYIV